MRVLLKFTLSSIFLTWLIGLGVLGCKARKKDTSDSDTISSPPKTDDEKVVLRSKPLPEVDAPLAISATFVAPNQLKLVFAKDQTDINGYYIMLGALGKGETECSRHQSLMVPKEFGATITIANDKIATVSLITACSFAWTSAGWSGKTARMSKPRTIKVAKD